jgi:hypothetical protein
VQSQHDWKFIGILSIVSGMIIITNSITDVSYSQNHSSNTLQNNLSGSNLSNSSSHNTTKMMQRGNIAMGFDQNNISHEFTATTDGGQIKITALDDKDEQTITQIQTHTRDIQMDFTEGNFTKPFYIHAQSVPGTDQMSQNKEQIQYQIQDLKNGSILMLFTNDSSLVDSINQFMTFQSTEHTGH